MVDEETGAPEVAPVALGRLLQVPVEPREDWKYRKASCASSNWKATISMPYTNGNLVCVMVSAMCWSSMPSLHFCVADCK